MADEGTTLATFFDAWHHYQALLVAAITPLDADQLGLRPAPGLRSIRETVAHVIGARARWFAEDIGNGGPTLAELATWDRPGAKAHSAADLARGLDDTWREMHEAIAGWSPDDWGQTYGDETTRFGPFTRRWVVWHVIEHDVHHGGEVAIVLGMHDLAAPAL